MLNELFNCTQKQNITLKRTREKQSELNQDLALGSVFGLLALPQPDNSDYEEETFVRNQEYEAKHRKLKTKKKGRRL